MLERAAGCLEPGVPRFVPRLQKSACTRRKLHSAFWSHGGSEINAPAWWLLLSGTATPKTRMVEYAQTRNQVASFLLEFLYPAKTLAFLEEYSKWKFSAPANPRSRKFRLKGGKYRAFTTTTSSAQVEAAVAANYDLAEAEKATHEASHRDAKLRMLFRLLQTEVEEHLEEARDLVGTLDHCRSVTSQVAEWSSQSSETLTDKARIRLFGVIPLDRRKSEDYHTTIKAALEQDDYNLARHLD